MLKLTSFNRVILLKVSMKTLFAAIIFISLFNILYTGKKEVKSIAISIGISVVETLLIWFVFGYIFNITLP